MNPFVYNGRNLRVEKVPVEKLARRMGTPVYVYSSTAFVNSFQALTQVLSGIPHLICYSVKANSNLSLLKLLSRRGAGFDIVSKGELYRVKKAGGDPRKVVFSGVGKTEKEIEEALRANILLFNVESAEELELLDRLGRKMHGRAPFALRVNPDVDARTHRHIATGLMVHKFGVPFKEALGLYEKSRQMKGVIARGLDCHIGSQMTELAPVQEALQQMAGLYQNLQARGFELRYLDVGGGLGIIYRKEKPPSIIEYARAVRQAADETGATILLEPGRLLVGNAGILLTRVLFRKKTKGKTWVIVDAGTNDLLRPALYEAEHEILPVHRRTGRPVLVDVVGPLCESSDVLAGNRRMALPKQRDLLAIMSAGAYGMSMSSNYNSRPRPAEVLVEGSHFRVIRKRESYEDLLRGEKR